MTRYGCRLATVFGLVLLTACAGSAPPDDASERSEPQAQALPTIGSIERLDPAVDAIVPPDAALELISEGVDGEQWTEGPSWAPALGALVYSEIPTNTLYLWRAGETPTVWLRPSGYTGDVERGGEMGSNGLALDTEGRLLLAQHGDRRIARLDAPWDAPEPRFVTLADAYDGKRLNSPNDIAVRANGDIYFTDPPYGLEQGMDDPAKELDFQGVYRIAVDGTLTLLTDELSRPNGIVFSPDQRTLYVSNSSGETPVIMAYDVEEDGGLANGRVFFDSSGDGMAVDQRGNVYVAGPSHGVFIIAPDGTHLGSLLSTERTSNCTFGDDGSTLYITGVHVLRIRLTTTGVGF